MFNLFGILWSLWISMLISLSSFETSSVIISVNMISVSFSDTFETSKMFMLIHLMVYHKSCGLFTLLCHSYLLLFFWCNNLKWSVFKFADFSSAQLSLLLKPSIDIFFRSSIVFFRISVVLIYDFYLFVKLTLFMYCFFFLISFSYLSVFYCSTEPF